MNEPPEPELAQIYAGMAKNAQEMTDYEFSDKCCDIGLQICRTGNNENFGYVNGILLWIKANNCYRRNNNSEAISHGKEALLILQYNHGNNPETVKLVQQQLQEWIGEIK
jgi:hypothetical protein